MENDGAVVSYPVPDTRMPFVNAEFAALERNGRTCLAATVWAGKGFGRIFFINPWTGKSEMRPLPCDEPGAYMLQTGPDGRLYIGSGTGNLYRYDPAKDAFETLVTGQMSSITWGGCVTERHVVWSASPGHACVYDWRAGKLLHALKPLDTERPEALYGHRVIPTPDGKVLLGMSSPQAKIILLDPASGERRSIVTPEMRGKVWTRDAIFFDAETLAFFCDAELLLYRYPSFELVRKVPPPAGIKALGGRACFCGGRYYALSAPDGSLWRLDPAQTAWEAVRRDWIGGYAWLWPLNARTLCAINGAGTFYRYDTERGETFSAEVDAWGPVGTHALCPLPQLGRIFGGPFINQRFWEIQLPDGRGQDLGRASVGGGQINEILWDEATRRVLMASYTTCTVTAFNPERPARWPENPRVLARVEHEQMRPRSFVHDGRHTWLASGPEYGQLGGALSRIDPLDGAVRTWRNIVPEQTPNNLVADPARKRIYLSTEVYADCKSAPATQTTAHLLAFNIETCAAACDLAPLEGCPVLLVLALLEPGRVLVKGGEKLFSWEPERERFELLGAAPPGVREVAVAPDGACYTSSGGQMGRLKLGSGAPAFEPLAPGAGHLLSISGGRFWYVVGQEVRALKIGDR